MHIIIILLYIFKHPFTVRRIDIYILVYVVGVGIFIVSTFRRYMVGIYIISIIYRWSLVSSCIR